MNLSPSKIRAYARIIDAGMKMINEVEEEYRVPVYVELIARYKWYIDRVDKRYVEAVKAELDIYKSLNRR